MDAQAADTAATSSPPSPDSFAFLNHSTDTLHHNLPPDVDDKQLARQKRRRTSPEDAAILEAAYQRDPKPDKTARLQLVSRVALDEKGVQIWFQNRRQTSRRKSRPLLPHEIAQYHMSRTGNAPSSSLPSTSGPDCLDDSGIDLTYEVPDSSQSHDDDDQEHGRKEEQSSPNSVERPLSPQSQSSKQDAVVLPPMRNLANAVLPTPLASMGYLANRRSAPSLRHSLSEQLMLPPPTPFVAPKRQLKKSSSFVRLSMNAEGKAEIVTKDASSPSPPRPQQVNYPEVVGMHTPPVVPAPRVLQRSASGRSRDSRSWEFWCDKEARSQLGYAAEKDASGSAAGAIGLLRTASGRNILGSVPSKRNSSLHSQHSSAKRPKLNHQKRPLQRSSTSMGRLQGDRPQNLPKLKHAHSAKSSHAKDTDSDKENWSPETERDSEFQVSDEASQSQLSEDDRTSVNQTRSGDASRRRVLSSTTDPENDEELSVFMRSGARKSGSASGDDLDCVQGLLSLSQGNWR